MSYGLALLKADPREVDSLKDDWAYPSDNCPDPSGDCPDACPVCQYNRDSEKILGEPFLITY